VIGRPEIVQRSLEWGLREDVVEKDYVLGWVLWGIGSDPVLGNGWVFKGGTCLKKCYVETYRFSEDLDFTCCRGLQAQKRRWRLPSVRCWPGSRRHQVSTLESESCASGSGPGVPRWRAGSAAAIFRSGSALLAQRYNLSRLRQTARDARVKP